MLKFCQVITYHPNVYNEFENDIIVTSEYPGTHSADAPIKTIIIYNNYTKQSKTHLSAHDGLRWKSGAIKKQIINKLLAEGSDLLYLGSFACDINWKSFY